MDTSGVIETKNGMGNLPEKPANEYLIHHEISPRKYSWRKVPSIFKIPGTVLKRVTLALSHIWRRHFMKRKKKRFEQSIALSRHFLFEYGYDVYFKVDTRGVINLVSPSVRNRFGYEPGELTGKSARKFCRNPEDHFLILNELCEKKIVNDYIMVIRKKKGNEVNVSLNAQAIIDRSTGLIAMEGIIRDIDERIRLNDVLQKADNELSGLMIKGIKAQNPKNVKAGKNIPWRELLTKNDVSCELENQTKFGNIVFVDSSINPLPDDDNELLGFIAAQRDITERKLTAQAGRNVHPHPRSAEFTGKSRGIQEYNRDSHGYFRP